jgi:hypothetical protein
MPDITDVQLAQLIVERCEYREALSRLYYTVTNDWTVPSPDARDALQQAKETLGDI